MAADPARQPSSLPDEGWGWAVVFGCAIHTFVTGGLLQYFTLIYENLRERFDSTAADTAWTLSIYACVSMMLAPVTSLLVKRFGCRKIVMLGAVLLALGILGMTYATSLPLVCLSFGAVSGIGNGLIITPKFVAISQWFDTQRGRAISLATMVDGCGVFVMTPVLYVLQYYYSYHVSWVVLAGFMMQCMVGGALLRKPFAWECQASGNVPEQENIEEEESLYEFEKAVRSRMHSAASDTCENTITSTADSVLTPKMHLLNPSMLNDYAGSMDDIFVGFKRRISQSCNALAACEDKNALYKRRRTVSMEEFTLATVCGIEEEPFDTKHTDYYDQSDYNSDCEWTGYDPCDSDMRDTPANGRHTIKKTKLIKEKMLHYLDYRLLVDSKYLSFTLLAVMFVLGSSMRNTHFAGLCKEKHISEMDIMILITTLGGITTALKFLSGSLFDFPQVRIHRKHIFFIMSLLFGTMLAVAPQMTSLPGIYIVWIIFITASTIMTTQESVILADLVSHESLPSAIGINRFARSIGVLIGPTVGGYLKDTTRLYNSSYLTFGIAVVLAAVFFEVITSWDEIRSCNPKESDLSEIQ